MSETQQPENLTLDYCGENFGKGTDETHFCRLPKGHEGSHWCGGCGGVGYRKEHERMRWINRIFGLWICCLSLFAQPRYSRFPDKDEYQIRFQPLHETRSIGRVAVGLTKAEAEGIAFQINDIFQKRNPDWKAIAEPTETIKAKR